MAKVRLCTSAVEERAVESGVVGLRALLRGTTQERPLEPHFQPINRFVERNVIGEIVPIKIESVTQFSHVLQPIRRFAVAVAVFEPKAVETTWTQRANPPLAGSSAYFLTLFS